MSHPNDGNPQRRWPLLAGMLAGLLAACGAMVSGGLSSGVTGLLVTVPAFVSVAKDQRALRAAVATSLSGLAGLGAMQLGGMLPPPLLSTGSFAAWFSGGLVVAYAAWIVRRLVSPAQGPENEPISGREGGRDRGAPAPGHKGHPADTADNSADPSVRGQIELTGDGPLLVVDISELGRIRAVDGAVGLFPGLAVGVVADRVLRDETGGPLPAGRSVAASGEAILVMISPVRGGTRLCILRDDEIGQAEMSELEARLRARTEFFAGLGHDLKSPLNAVIGFADMMESEMLGPMPEVYRDYPGLIRESGETLLRLVEDMLGYAKSEAGTYELDTGPLDVLASAQAVVRQLEAGAARVGVRLDLRGKGEVVAQADARAVQRIWDNLVSNAIKYSPHGSSVILAARVRAGIVQLSVSDEGAGMDAEDLARIARPFEQGRNARGHAGTGLGLAMVRRLAELHGGKLVIRTAPGEGTQMIVTLPAAGEQASHAAE